LNWNPEAVEIEREPLEKLDVVIHLAGENLSAGRWSQERKRRIRGSRVDGTRLLSETLADLKLPPRIFLSASAAGFYGNRGDERLTEESEHGSGFLSEVCQAWESATRPAEERGISVFHLRFGIVLAPHGGVLAKMLPLFKLGLGGVLGKGRQYWSWIAIDDLVGIMQYLVRSHLLAGPVNVVAPRPATNREFTETLGRVVSRPTIFPAPAPFLRLAFGQMADEALLSSSRVEPTRLLSSGYTFRYPDLEPALRHCVHG
jgi:uncharacterized protein (TIGR01777 family)